MYKDFRVLFEVSEKTRIQQAQIIKTQEKAIQTQTDIIENQKLQISILNELNQRLTDENADLKKALDASDSMLEKQQALLDAAMAEQTPDPSSN